MLKNKKGLVFGIANNHSIAWGIAKQLAENGAEIAIGYQNEILLKRVKPLSEEINSKILIECDFNNNDSINKSVEIIKKEWGTIDFIIHAVAFADKSELNGRYVDTTKDNFISGSANIENLDDSAKDCNILLKTENNVEIEQVMSNSFGFGGTNATLVFSKYHA